MRRRRGFTLVELMIVVAIIGILAALAIYGVQKYLASSKSTEAKQSVGYMARAAQAAFEREREDGSAVGEGQATQTASHVMCDSAIPVPASVPPGNKYQPKTGDGFDYETGDKSGGWRCLRFRITQPTYYQYQYNRNTSVVAPSSPAACSSNCFEAGAMGDLNGNGTYSRFARTGFVNTATGSMRQSTQIHVEAEAE